MEHQTGDWQALRLFNLYRMVLSGLLVTLLILPQVKLAEALWSPGLFGAVALLYLVVAVGFSFSILSREGSWQWQLGLQVVVDLAALSLLGFAAGRPVEIFGSLMLIPVAFAGYWQLGRQVILFASLAIIGLLGGVFAHQWLGNQHYPLAALGALCCVQLFIVLLSRLLGRRSEASQALALKRARHLASLTELNAFIVQRMEEGVIVVDAEDRVRLGNPVAQRLFPLLATLNLPCSLHRVSPQLAEVLRAWRQGRAYDSERLLPLRLQLTAPQPERDGVAMLLLEDTSEQNNRLQQEKLAALGRLTASLAHEVRNPLGAIGHASQLLAESPQLHGEDQKLLAIIRKQVQRLDCLIEEILTLSRRKAPRWRLLSPAKWLHELLAEWRLAWPDAWQQLQLQDDLEDSRAQLQVDPAHLRQVLVILVDNALRHARQPDRPLSLRLRLYRQRPSATLCMELCDNGPGIDAAVRQQIWEPFFSTAATGSGLGLYLARELCDANYAELSYSAAEGGGSCFRIAFPMERPLTRKTHE